MITITYWEGDETKDKPFTKVTYVEWMNGSKSYYAHGDEGVFDPFGENPDDATEIEDERGNYETRGIPNDVREALAYLIAPHLRPRAVASAPSTDRLEAALARAVTP